MTGEGAVAPGRAVTSAETGVPAPAADPVPGLVESEGYPVGIDPTRPHAARVYDWWLGGKDNFAADRELGAQFEQIFPQIRLSARENRRLLGRMVFHLVEAGVTQFIDLGTGIPTVDNTHEVAQRLYPAARVVYVDNDPIVLTHARALLTSTPEGVTDYLDADVGDPDRILTDAAGILDFTQPIAVISLMTLQFLGDEVYQVLQTYRDALGPGSYLALSVPTGDFISPQESEALMASYGKKGIPLHLRTRGQFARFFTGLDLIEPGIVPMAYWRADSESQPRPTPAEAAGYAAVGRRT